MIRVQVYLDEADDRWLEEQAAAHGTTKAAMMREGVRALRSREVPLEDDPLLRLIGHIQGDDEGPNDGSVQHDKYLADWELERNRHNA